MMLPGFNPGMRSALRSLRGLGESCPYIGPANGQPPVKGACTDDLYQFGVIQDNKLNCWVPKFAQALRDLGYSPKVVGTYVAPGYGNCGYTFYNVYWDVPVPAPGSGTAPCGIYVGDLYVNSDPTEIAKAISGNCIAAAGAALSPGTVQTVSRTPEQAVMGGGAATPSAPSAVDRILATVTGGGAYTEQPAPASVLSSIPTWAWLAGGAAVLYLFMGRGK